MTRRAADRQALGSHRPSAPASRPCVGSGRDATGPFLSRRFLRVTATLPGNVCTPPSPTPCVVVLTRRTHQRLGPRTLRPNQASWDCRFVVGLRSPHDLGVDMPARRALWSLVMLLALATPAAAQRTWVEAKGPNITVISDAGASRARDVLWQFEQIREAITRTFPWVRVAWSRPLLVLAARDEASMRELAPLYWESGDRKGVPGVLADGRDRAYIAIRSDLKAEDREGVNPYQTVYWAYVAQALRETSPNLPPWIVRGLATALSNTLVREKEIQVGRVPPGSLNWLLTHPRLELRDVVTRTTEATSAASSTDLFTYDAWAWALVHYLAWGEKGANAPLFDKFVTEVVSGRDPVQATEAVLGDVSRFETGLNVYVHGEIFPFLKFSTAATLARDGFAVRDLPAAEAAAVRASFHVAMNRPAEVRTLAAEASRLAEGAGDEALALLAEREDPGPGLVTLFERAASRPTSSWYASYRAATLMRVTEGMTSLAHMESLLEQATAKNPMADDAWARLGGVKAAFDRDAPAVAAAEKAVALSPGSSRYHQILGSILARQGRDADARAEAGRAMALARTADERSAAQRVLADLAKAAAAAEIRAKGPEVERMINACDADASACAAALPIIAADCDTGLKRSAVACAFAGHIVDDGRGVPEDIPRAVALYTKGCDGGYAPSCWRLASLRAIGRGVPKDLPAALRVLEPACQPNGREACARLGYALASTGDLADLAKARTVLTASCDGGYAPSCELLKRLPPPQ
ncbi:MAG: tetratricopeptide repeat protein [Vicinamibacterales bacterium]